MCAISAKDGRAEARVLAPAAVSSPQAGKVVGFPGYSVFRAALAERDVSASSMRSVATQASDTNRTLAHDHSGKM